MSNIIPFVLPVVATAPKTVVTLAGPKRFHTPQEIRDILKAAGANASKVSVKVNSSANYITVTVRDHKVLPLVEKIAADLDSWKSDMGDCASGQAVNVELSHAAKEAMAAPFMDVINYVASHAIPVMGQGQEIAPDILIWHNTQGLWLETRSGVRRSYIWTRNVVAQEPSALAKLALDLASLTNVVETEKATKAA